MQINREDIIQRFQALQSIRSEWERVWQLCSDYVLPRAGEFRKGKRIRYDDTAPLALGRFAAAMESVLTPRTRRWHTLVTGDSAIDQDQEVSGYLEWLRDAMFAARYAPEANFSNQITEAYLNLGVFGTACIFVDDQVGVGIRYRNIPMFQLFIAEDSVGRVDTVFRCYRLTARQAFQEFGPQLPQAILADAEDPRRMSNEHEFVHAVFPRRDINQHRRDSKNMPFASYHIAMSSKEVVRESGYTSMPYAVSRFVLAPGDVYGRSPAMSVLGSILQLNTMQKTIIRAAEKMVDPPIMTADDDILKGFSLRPGSVIPGGIDEQGNVMAQPLNIEGSLPIGLEMIEAHRQVVNEAYYLNLFQILVEKPGDQTATQVIERAQEKAQLLAPAMGRQQSELLRGIIVRELDILSQAGIFHARPIPEKLIQAGSGITPKYETEMTQALDASEGTSTMRFLESVGAMAQMSPGILDIVNYDEAARVMRRSFAAPAEIILGDDELAAIRQQRAQAQQQQAMMAQLQQAGDAGQAIAGTLGSLATVEQQLSGMTNVR